MDSFNTNLDEREKFRSDFVVDFKSTTEVLKKEDKEDPLEGTKENKLIPYKGKSTDEIQSESLIKIPVRGYSDKSISQVQVNKENVLKVKEHSQSFGEVSMPQGVSSLSEITKYINNLKQQLVNQFNQKEEKTRKKFEAKMKKLQTKRTKELEKLGKLESFILNQITAKPLSSASQVKVKNTGLPVLVNINKNTLYVSKDLQSVQKSQIPSIQGTSFLLYDSNTLLIALSSSQEILSLKINDGSVTKIIPMTQNRKFAAFSFIGNHPALIGGVIHPETSATDSVEILKNLNCWQSVSSLNKPRSHGMAIQHKECTYLFSGYPIDLMNTVERFTGSHWETVGFRLSDKIVCFGLMSYENEILYFGGVSKVNKKLVSKVGRINPEFDNEFREIDTSVYFVSNCVGSCEIFEGDLCFVDCVQEKLVRIKI